MDFDRLRERHKLEACEAALARSQAAVDELHAELQETRAAMARKFQDMARKQEMRQPIRLTETEKGFQGAIVDLAKSCNWRVYHTYRSIKSPEGFPDLVLVRPPDVLIAEVKSVKGRVSVAQNQWLACFTACPGVETYLWRPADWETIVARLTRSV